MKKDQDLTWDDIKAMYAENARQAKEDRRQAKEDAKKDRLQAKEDRRQMKESDRKLKKENALWKKEMKESDHKQKEEYALWKKEMKESDRKQKEEYALWKKEMKESDRKQKEEYALWKKEMKESDRKQKEEYALWKKEMNERDEKAKQDWEKGNKEMWEYLKELGREVGGIAHSNGALAEEYFYNAFRRNMTFVDETFDTIKRNLSYNDGNLGAEFDLVLFNGKSAAIIEIKYNAKPDNIEIDTLISRVEVFRILFPQYAHYNIYLGVAAMSFKKDFAWRLHRAGIATIRPVGKKMVVYDKNVRVF